MAIFFNSVLVFVQVVAVSNKAKLKKKKVKFTKN